MGPQNNHSYQQFKNNLQCNKVPVVFLPHDDFSQQMAFINLPEGYEGLVDLTAGVLYADRAIKAVQVKHTVHIMPKMQ